MVKRKHVNEPALRASVVFFAIQCPHFVGRELVMGDVNHTHEMTRVPAKFNRFDGHREKAR